MIIMIKVCILYRYNPVNKGGLMLKDPFLISKKIRQKFM